MFFTFLLHCLLLLNVCLNTSSICRPRRSHHYFLRNKSLLNINDFETTIITGTTSPAADSTEVTHSDSVLSKAVKTLLTPDNFAEKHVGPRRQSSHTPTCTDSSLTTPISSRNLSLLNRHSPIHKSPSPSSISHTSTLPPIIVHTSPNLKFNSQNVDIYQPCPIY